MNEYTDKELAKFITQQNIINEQLLSAMNTLIERTAPNLTDSDRKAELQKALLEKAEEQLPKYKAPTRDGGDGWTQLTNEMRKPMPAPKDDDPILYRT